ncbi:hypothetical protein NL676_009179 [Syzygium grande]|nr:hypothetical protein NL676_009179 [Syzygium grande]
MVATDCGGGLSPPPAVDRRRGRSPIESTRPRAATCRRAGRPLWRALQNLGGRFRILRAQQPPEDDDDDDRDPRDPSRKFQFGNAAYDFVHFMP